MENTTSVSDASYIDWKDHCCHCRWFRLYCTPSAGRCCLFFVRSHVRALFGFPIALFSWCCMMVATAAAVSDVAYTDTRTVLSQHVNHLFVSGNWSLVSRPAPRHCMGSYELYARCMVSISFLFSARTVYWNPCSASVRAGVQHPN